MILNIFGAYCEIVLNFAKVHEEFGVKGETVESSDFEAWLSAVRSLTAGQRGLPFLELTLAEAADLSEDGAEESGSAAAPPTVVEAEPGKASNPRALEALLAAGDPALWAPPQQGSGRTNTFRDKSQIVR